MAKATLEWKKTAKRFVAFFDIMGFKDLVQRNAHGDILNKLEKLKNLLSWLESTNSSNNSEVRKIKAKKFQIKSVTFSDSIIFFSNGETLADLQKIVADSYMLIWKAMENGIAIKGALAFGEITVDFKNSLFFGQPIIDSFLLHEEIAIYGAVLDCSFEKKLATMKTTQNFPDSVLASYKVPLRKGKATHTIIKPFSSDSRAKFLEHVRGIYSTVAGAPRVYVDNTVEFLESLKPDDFLAKKSPSSAQQRLAASRASAGGGG